MFRQLAVAVVIVLFGATVVRADDAERGTAKQAQHMVELGILLFEDEGAAIAFDEINTGPPPFRHHDLYLFAIDAENGLLVANAVHSDRVGTDVLDAKDADGTPFIRNMVEQATKYGVWVDYQYEDPLTGAVTPKSSWVVLHDGYVFGCGIYKQ